MSIPRDTMVNVSWDIKRINSAYNYGGGGDKGIQALNKEISQLVGFAPDFQVVIEWDAVGELVTALGGVWFDVPRDMNYDDPTQNLHIHIKKGYQELNGEQAMEVLRYRHDNRRPNGTMPGYPDGDLGRIKTQQAFLAAVVAQCLKFENVLKVNALIQVFSDNVETNLSINDMGWFGKQAVFGGLKTENVTFFTMPCTNHLIPSRTYPNDPQSFVTPNSDELLKLINEHLNPFIDDVTLPELDIMSVKQDGTISSSTGVLEDTKHNSFVLSAKDAKKAVSSSSVPPTYESPSPKVTIDSPLPQEITPTPLPTQSEPTEESPPPAEPPEGIPFF